jgi:hypothetical protein
MSVGRITQAFCKGTISIADQRAHPRGPLHSQSPGARASQREAVHVDFIHDPDALQTRGRHDAIAQSFLSCRVILSAGDATG